MLIDAILPPVDLKEVPQIAKAAEVMGFGALWSTETVHDPFLPGALIAEHTQRLDFGTAVAIAFARSPATMAYTAWDLAQSSGGHFILGLGTQVKAHVERRFGMTWPESVVAKLREQVGAIRAFWNSWQTDEPLKFRGEYYKLTLMSPFFNPGPISHPGIPIYLAGVNRGLAHLAGEVSDGFHVHPFHSPKYLDEVLLPAIRKGTVESERSKGDIKISATAFVASSQEERLFVRSQIAFYASTPSYRPVMTLHGWQEVAKQLSEMVARGKWNEMPALVSNEMLETFAVVADAGDLPYKLFERYAGLVDRLNLYIPFVPGERDIFWSGLVHGIAGLE